MQGKTRRGKYKAKKKERERKDERVSTYPARWWKIDGKSQNAQIAGEGGGKGRSGILGIAVYTYDEHVR